MFNSIKIAPMYVVTVTNNIARQPMVVNRRKQC
nr:MAG TPA: hypothetical protein [Caudoviricetes sp.]